VKVGFVGLSHLGIVYSLASAARGFDVVAYEPEPERRLALSEGRFPIEEPGLAELLSAQRERLTYTGDVARLAECELVFVALDVPTDDDDQSDLAPVRDLLRATWPSLGPACSVVVLSQVRPGFMRSIAGSIDAGGAAPDARLFYQVETLIFGAAIERALHPERYIVGAARPDAPLPAPYRDWLDSFACPVLVMRYESAELAKIAINCFLVSSVATTNTLAEICEAVGAEWSEIAPALRLDRRIGPHAYLAPGLGIAGGNLERDLATVQGLAAEHGTDARVVAAWQRNSAHRKDWVLRLLHRHVLPLRANPSIAVLGIAYKPDTHSTKNSASLALLANLSAWPVRAYDPCARLDVASFAHVTVCSSALDAVADADVVVLMTPWKELTTLDASRVRERMRGDFVLDPYGAWQETLARSAGVRYFRLGSGSAS
jgi:UDPglucose 6-dehydrogenase